MHTDFSSFLWTILKDSRFSTNYWVRKNECGAYILHHRVTAPNVFQSQNRVAPTELARNFCIHMYRSSSLKRFQRLRSTKTTNKNDGLHMPLNFRVIIFACQIYYYFEEANESRKLGFFLYVLVSNWFLSLFNPKIAIKYIVL